MNEISQSFYVRLWFTLYFFPLNTVSFFISFSVWNFSFQYLHASNVSLHHFIRTNFDSSRAFSTYHLRVSLWNSFYQRFIGRPLWSFNFHPSPSVFGVWDLSVRFIFVLPHFAQRSSSILVSASYASLVFLWRSTCNLFLSLVLGLNAPFSSPLILSLPARSFLNLSLRSLSTLSISSDSFNSK